MKKNRFKPFRLNALWAALLISTALTGCGEPEIAVYSQEQPAFDFKQYFDGRVEGWGMFIDRSGEVKKRFTMTFDCEWKGNVGTLTEQFVYSDGVRQTHVWTMVLDGDRITGTASDVMGQAVGRIAGNAVHLNYTLAVPYEGNTYQFDFSDWSHRVDDKVVFNRVQMKKFGFTVGELILSYRKP